MENHFDFIFEKTGEMVYISHLDLLRLLARSARRADLKVALTKGFNPHFKIKLKRAMKLGMESNAEEGEIFLDEDLGISELKSRWQRELPAGVNLKEVRLR
ncbi:MAG TPA: TIGR03936 family radical SAM-associated protein [Candidatus Omnitrophota bacterium]|nr:TIGR03936 family radical SAM-associated protein [Candidatus Omnitrophota bacterium]